MDFTTQPVQSRVEKPWGFEIIFTPENLSRVGKILFISAGKRLSLQYHESKEETLALFSGEAEIIIENAKGEMEEIKMKSMGGYTILPGQKHRIRAINDSYIIEVSSSEAGTTVRLEDDYSRPDETEALRDSENRGWNVGAK